MPTTTPNTAHGLRGSTHVSTRSSRAMHAYAERATCVSTQPLTRASCRLHAAQCHGGTLAAISATLFQGIANSTSSDYLWARKHYMQVASGGAACAHPCAVRSTGPVHHTSFFRSSVHPPRSPPPLELVHSPEHPAWPFTGPTGMRTMHVLRTRSVAFRVSCKYTSKTPGTLFQRPLGRSSTIENRCSAAGRSPAGIRPHSLTHHAAHIPVTCDEPGCLQHDTSRSESSATQRSGGLDQAAPLPCGDDALMACMLRMLCALCVASEPCSNEHCMSTLKEFRVFGAH